MCSLIWILFAWYILVSTGKDDPPNTLRISFRVKSQLFEVTPESYKIPYFNIIRDVTAVYISIYLWLTGILVQLDHDCLELAPTHTVVELNWVVSQHMSNDWQLSWVELSRVVRHASNLWSPLDRRLHRPRSWGIWQLALKSRDSNISLHTK